MQDAPLQARSGTEHVVHTEEDGTAILYIDRHLVHEVTSPQALKAAPGWTQSVASQLYQNSRPQHQPQAGAGLRRHHRPHQQRAVTTLNDNIAGTVQPPSFRSCPNAKASCM